MAHELSFSIAGPEPDVIVGLLAKQGWIPPRKPSVVSIDSVRETRIATDWFASAWSKKTRDLMASWDEGERLSVFDTNVVSGVQLLDFSAESVLAPTPPACGPARRSTASSSWGASKRCRSTGARTTT